MNRIGKQCIRRAYQALQQHEHQAQCLFSSCSLYQPNAIPLSFVSTDYYYTRTLSSYGSTSHQSHSRGATSTYHHSIGRHVSSEARAMGADKDHETEYSSTVSADSSPNKELTMTVAAVDRLKGLKEKKGEVDLRVLVDGGGCSGFQYVFEIDAKGPKDDDYVLEEDGVRLLCDSVSMEFLHGSTIDFESDLMKSKFVVRPIRTVCGYYEYILRIFVCL